MLTPSVPGPCDYCRALGAPCQTDVGKRKQRPYYFVSEEEWRLMTRILKHYIPDRELNLPNLRAISSELELQTENEGHSGIPVATAPGLETTASTASPVQEQSPMSVYVQDGLLLEEIGDLHEELGCMLIDSVGQHRE